MSHGRYVGSRVGIINIFSLLQVSWVSVTDVAAAGGLMDVVEGRSDNDRAAIRLAVDLIKIGVNLLITMQCNMQVFI